MIFQDVDKSNSKSKEFDDLLDGLLSKEIKQANHFNEAASPNTSVRIRMDSLELNIDETSKSRHISPKTSTPLNNNIRTSFFRNQHQEEEDHGMN
jgi:hypothetical protein